MHFDWRNGLPLLSLQRGVRVHLRYVDALIVRVYAFEIGSSVGYGSNDGSLNDRLLQLKRGVGTGFN